MGGNREQRRFCSHEWNLSLEILARFQHHATPMNSTEDPFFLARAPSISPAVRAQGGCCWRWRSGRTACCRRSARQRASGGPCPRMPLPGRPSGWTMAVTNPREIQWPPSCISCRSFRPSRFPRHQPRQRPGRPRALGQTEKHPQFVRRDLRVRVHRQRLTAEHS